MRGHRQLEAANRHLGAASPKKRSKPAETSLFTDDEEEIEIALAPSAGFGDWSTLAQEQLDHYGNDGNLTSVLKCRAGMAVALQDRNSFAGHWPNIFVVPVRLDPSKRTHVEVFDTNSKPINEPSSGVMYGLQTIAGFQDECSKDNEYYRLPQMRPPPRWRGSGNNDEGGGGGGGGGGDGYGKDDGDGDGGVGDGEGDGGGFGERSQRAEQSVRHCLHLPSVARGASSAALALPPHALPLLHAHSEILE